MGRSLLCATVTERTTARALAVMGRTAARADVLEVRLDALADPDPERLVREAPRPVLVTCRSVADGGGYRGSEDERLDLLRRGAAAGAAFVDLELRCAGALGDLRGTRRIVSHHDFEETPGDLGDLASRLLDAGPDVAKLAVTPRGPGDTLRVLRLLRDAGDPRLAVLTMGPAGLPGRVLAARFGSAIVYGAARAGAAGAPGQPTLRSLVEDYALDRDLGAAAVVLLLGARLGHSVSPRMMNRALPARGIDVLYVPFECEDPAPLLAALPGLAAAGAAVTIPLKETVAGLVDRLEGTAARVGAVNTVVRGTDGLLGLNTDLGGALDALRAVRRDLAGARALVLGAGGAARAVACGLSAAGARVAVASRTPARACRLAREVGGRAVDPADLEAGDLDVVVNATPVGQWPAVGDTPLPADLLRAGQVVLDTVYNPLETRLLREARAAGAAAIPGIEMLARQGARQVEAWFGRSVPVGDLAAEGREGLRRTRTIVLVGMRGAGKSTVGRLLADRLGRDFRDLDEEIERKDGRSIPRMFAEDGEPAFREREREALRDALRTEGAVLALGGGALDDPDGLALVRERAPLAVLLTAPAGILAGRVRGSGRPSLSGRPPEEEIGELLRDRTPRYLGLSPVVVDTSAGGPEEAADEALEALGF